MSTSSASNRPDPDAHRLVEVGDLVRTIRADTCCLPLGSLVTVTEVSVSGFDLTIEANGGECWRDFQNVEVVTPHDDDADAEILADYPEVTYTRSLLGVTITGPADDVIRVGLALGTTK